MIVPEWNTTMLFTFTHERLPVTFSDVAETIEISALTPIATEFEQPVKQPDGMFAWLTPELPLGTYIFEAKVSESDGRYAAAHIHLHVRRRDDF